MNRKQVSTILLLTAFDIKHLFIKENFAIDKKTYDITKYLKR